MRLLVSIPNALPRRYLRGIFILRWSEPKVVGYRSTLSFLRRLAWCKRKAECRSPNIGYCTRLSHVVSTEMCLLSRLRADSHF